MIDENLGQAAYEQFQKCYNLKGTKWPQLPKRTRENWTSVAQAAINRHVNGISEATAQTEPRRTDRR